MISRFFVLLFVIYISKSCFSQALPELTIEKVKSDVKENCFDDLDLSEYIDDRPIEIFYSKQYALVHIEYRMEESEAFMKQSTALIYQLENRTWKCLQSIPYNYSIEQLGKDSELFISNNFICTRTGVCERYIEVQRLEKGELKILKKFEGFSNYAYWDGLLGMEKEEQIKDAIGDTIEIDFEILKYEITKSNGLSLQLKKHVKVLEGFDEYNIKTNGSETITTLEIDNSRNK